MRGGYSSKNENVIYVHGIKEDDNGKKLGDWENRFTIDWDDRFDDDILETVDENCFLTVGVEKDTKGKTFAKKFLSAYDAVEYIHEHLEDGMVVNVKGNLTYSEYNEKVNVKKEITSIFLSKVDDPENYKATFTQTILVDSASIGKKDAEKGTVGLAAYAVDYVGKIDINGQKVKIAKNVTHPFNFEVHVDEDKPEMTAKMLQKYFKVVKKTDIYELAVEGDIIEGQAIVNISDDDIPDDIKELIEMGVYTEEEAKAKCAIGNNSREKRMIIRRPLITYVGKDEDRKPTVALDTTKYKETDKVFLAQLIESLDNGGDNETDVVNNPSFDTEGNEDDDLLKMLESLE